MSRSPAADRSPPYEPRLRRCDEGGPDSRRSTGSVGDPRPDRHVPNQRSAAPVSSIPRNAGVRRGGVATHHVAATVFGKAVAPRRTEQARTAQEVEVDAPRQVSRKAKQLAQLTGLLGQSRCDLGPRRSWEHHPKFVVLLGLPAVYSLCENCEVRSILLWCEPREISVHQHHRP